MTVERGKRVIVGDLLLAILLTGCAATMTVAPSPTSSPSAIPVPSASPVPSARAAEPTIKGAAAPCVSADLEISAVNSSAALGTVGGSLRFQNLGALPCTLSGWPGVVGVTAAGARTTARHATALLDYPTVSGTPEVMIGPGESAFAAYAGGDTSGNASPCPPNYDTLEVTAPGGTRVVSIPAFNAWYGHNLPSCVGIEVTPVVAASLVPSLATLRP